MTYQKNLLPNNLRAFPVWIALGWREFARPFSRECWSGVCPGGRDLFWLTLFFALAMSFGLLILGTRNGLLDSFSNTFLGYVPQYGIPLALAPHAEAGGFGVNRDVQSKVAAIGNGETGPVPGLRAFPYQDMGGRGLEPHFARLPDADIWRKGDDIPPYYGWAVFRDDPLWTIDKAPAKGEPPLALLLNRSVFRSAFDYPKYRETLRHQLPRAWWERDLPKDLKNLHDLKALWLFVLVGKEKELTRFHIHWVENIPGASRPAFLYPMETLRALEEARANPRLRYFPEAANNSNGNHEGKRITGLTVLNSGKDSSTSNKQAEFAQCLGGETSLEGEDIAISLPYPKPAAWVAACRSQAEIAEDRVVESTVFGHKLLFTPDGYLNLPCDSIQGEMARELDKEKKCQVRRLDIPGNHRDDTLRALAQCTQGNMTDDGYGLDLPNMPSWSTIVDCAKQPNVNIAVENLAIREGTISLDKSTTSRIIVYVPDRHRLSEAIDRLLGITVGDNNSRALSLTSAYRDAISRVNYLTDTIGSIALPYGALFFFLMIFLLWVILGALIGHRRERYGVLLARGIPLSRLYAMVYLQMVLSAVLGLVVAWIASGAMRAWIEGLFSPVFDRYRDMLGLTDIPVLMSITPGNYLFIVLAFVILACTIATVLLWMAPIFRKADVADLLQT
uniref:FtsX-like permease family protein n=1 Tax=Candidatus Kentrum sp. MB TaxID=2138164 RepID=A0A450XYL7_9GAMM|nr:MAG: FtsX-like permease family protein [Candidatus Kentron sp. MB]VFK34356.1 MAG: FtsX-like permease family protein [Candidatus Kentron sp. MB]VFK76674.1 MAG: FtsX-like permease family protein [Candidatus Kentron sp. MB]